MIEELRTSWRRELLYVCLATMEVCWFYPWLLLLSGAASGRRIPFVVVLCLFLGVTYLTRLFHQRAVRLSLQRSATVSLALLCSLLLLRLYIYVGYPVSDLSWLGHLVWDLGNVMQRIPPALVIFVAVLYIWLRGIQLAQRELDVESVGFSFRAGIIAFLWLFLLSLLGSPADATPYAFAFFFVGLVAVALGRIESVSQSRLGIRSPFNLSWLAILLGATLVVSALSLLATRVFSLQNVLLLGRWVRPAADLLGKLAYPLLLVVAMVLEGLISILIRFFSGLLGGEASQELPILRIAEQLQEQLQQMQPTEGVLLFVLQLIKWVFLGSALLMALAILVFSISRVRKSLESQRLADHDSVWDADEVAREAEDAVLNRWQRLLAALQARWARLQGEEFSLASIRQVYVSLVKLATASGVPRRQAQTPYEYAAALLRSFPGSAEEIGLITEAYVRTHYGERSFSTAYVQRVRDAWLAIRQRQEEQSSTG